MPKIYNEPELTVRFKFDGKLFSNKAHDWLNENDIIDELKKCSKAAKTYTSDGEEITNKSLKCHITDAGNYKLYRDVYFRHKHKEEDIHKNDKTTNPNEYYKWSSEINNDKYLNQHLDEFEIKIYYGSGYNELHHLLKVEL